MAGTNILMRLHGFDGMYLDNLKKIAGSLFDKKAPMTQFQRVMSMFHFQYGTIHSRRALGPGFTVSNTLHER